MHAALPASEHVCWLKSVGINMRYSRQQATTTALGLQIVADELLSGMGPVLSLERSLLPVCRSL